MEAVGLAAAAGQTLLPVPMLGAVLGSLTGKLVASALKEGLREPSSALIERLAEDERRALEQLDQEYCALVQRLGASFDELERLAAAAFDSENNTALLKASVEFAEAVGVPEENILRTTADVDDLMLR